MKSLGLVISLILLTQNAWSFQRYGESYCKDPDYKCITIKRGDSWAQMFPKEAERDIVKRVNRMNVFLEPDMIIAVPKKLSAIQINDVSPFASHIASRGEKMIAVNKALFAWAAYDEGGELLTWGPISAGTQKCLELKEGCSTPDGSFRVTRKDGAECESRNYPRRINGVRGGGEMPWCIYFHKGFALHGSSELPGYDASLGCLRLFTADAKWLNEHFVEVPSDGGKGTLIVIN